MKGLDLARDYFRTHRDTLLAPYAQCRERIAAGLVGFGSECFGYDDDISADHDFGPGFCLWLTDEDYARCGEALQADYLRLPAEHLGFPARQDGPRAGQRVGVFSISGFYTQFLGAPQLPISDADWLQIPEDLLATAINGEVFEDPLGQFSGIRTRLAAYYPPSVRRLKLATAVAKMAQSGQYNLPRALARQSWSSAFMAQAEFMRHACEAAHVLAGSYAPYYKWLSRSVADLPGQWNLHQRIERLGRLTPSEARPLVEDICADMLHELIRQGFTMPGDAFLETHVDAILNHVGQGS